MLMRTFQISEFVYILKICQPVFLFPFCSLPRKVHEATRCDITFLVDNVLLSLSLIVISKRGDEGLFFVFSFLRLFFRVDKSWMINQTPFLKRLFGKRQINCFQIKLGHGLNLNIDTFAANEFH